jgi:hypothetical protein
MVRSGNRVKILVKCTLASHAEAFNRFHVIVVLCGAKSIQVRYHAIRPIHVFRPLF